MISPRIVAAALAALGFAGCVLGEYTAGDAADDALVPDGGDSGTSGSSGIAANDGQVTPIDAARDAGAPDAFRESGGPGFDAGPPPNCTSDDMLFCATFEDGTIPPSGWSYGDPSKTSLVMGPGRTTPGGALCKVTGAVAVSGVYLRVSELAPNNRKLTVRVSFLVDDPREGGDIVSFRLNSGVSLTLSIDAAGVVHGTGRTSDTPVLPVTRTVSAAAGTWHELRMELDIKAGKLASAVDGAELIAPLAFAANANQGSTNVILFLGGFQDDNNGIPSDTAKHVWPTTRFDDVSALMSPPLTGE